MKRVHLITQMNVQSACAWMAYGDRAFTLSRLGEGHPETP